MSRISCSIAHVVLLFLFLVAGVLLSAGCSSYPDAYQPLT